MFLNQVITSQIQKKINFIEIITDTTTYCIKNNREITIEAFSDSTVQSFNT